MKKCYDIPLEKKDLSLKGWNWGSVNFEGDYVYCTYLVDVLVYEYFLAVCTSGRLIRENILVLARKVTLMNLLPLIGHFHKTEETCGRTPYLTVI